MLDHFAEDYITELHGTLLRDLIDERKRAARTTVPAGQDEIAIAHNAPP